MSISTYVQIVYGVLLTPEIVRHELFREALDRAEDDANYTGEVEGFETMSDSGGEMTGFCGVELCQLAQFSSEDVTRLPLLPTAEQKKLVEEKVAKLNPELRKLAGDVGSWTLWSYS